MTVGTLILVGRNNNSLQIKFTNAKGNSVELPVPEAQLSQSLKTLKNNIDQLNNLEVELEEVGGQPKKVRQKGEVWEETVNTDQPNNRNPNNRNPNPQRQVNIQNHAPQGDFHNPYNFIPAPLRNTGDSELGDHKPAGHGVYHFDRWSGQISVTLTTKTPLLIPDAANATEDNNNHKTYPIRIGADGKPYLPSTSIKGVLRTAYEAVTNSRFSLFEKHEDRLAFRMPANIGLQMVPARIENGEIHLYPGTSEIGNDGKPQGAMYAAWLPRYERNSDRIANFAVRYNGGSLPQHGQRVIAWLEQYEKQRNGNPVFKYWRVRKIVLHDQNIGAQPQQGNGYGSHQPTGVTMRQVEGFVCITNKNIDNKHDERVFFTTENPTSVELTSDLRKKWIELISNYQEIHEDEIKKGKHSPPALQRSKWSRHVLGGNQEKTLSDGTLCYAHVSRNGNQYKVLNLYPVMITRGLYQFSPDKLLPDNLHPAISMEQLSPAERVFGWVKQKGKGSYKGNLRIGNVTCTSDDPIEDFGKPGFPLAILGQPQPQQARFYQAQDKNGTPLSNGIDKEEGYANSNEGLRGRKVYPHHKQLSKQEYRRTGDTRDDQNRSIQGWVKPNVTFQFNIDVTNLSSVELGGLLWLLSLPENHYHRLGGGKPLGFGSVQLAVNWEKTDLRTGANWKDYYSSLLPIDSPDSKEAQGCIGEFQQAVSKADGNNNFDSVSFIAAFCRCAKGFDDNLPIHYPRTTREPNPNGEGFDWFVENERVGKNAGKKVSLPMLTSDRGLPLKP